MERKVEKQISKELSEDKDSNVSERTRRVDKTLEMFAAAETSDSSSRVSDDLLLSKQSTKLLEKLG